MHVSTSFARVDSFAAMANRWSGNLETGSQSGFVMEEKVVEGEQIVQEMEGPGFVMEKGVEDGEQIVQKTEGI